MRVYSLEDEETIKIMLNQYGMVGATMFITRHFRHYKGGVIRHDRGKRLGGHGVVIIGYDRDAEGVEYWTIRVSTGPHFRGLGIPTLGNWVIPFILVCLFSRIPGATDGEKRGTFELSEGKICFTLKRAFTSLNGEG